MLGDYAERFVEISLPMEWVVRKVSYDYGLDLNVELVRNYSVTGKVFSIQVKARESAPPGDIAVRLSASSLEYMRARPEPVLVVAFVAEDNEAYWLWVQDAPVREAANVTLRVPRDNRLSTTDWDRFAEQVISYYESGGSAATEEAGSTERFGRYSVDIGRSDDLSIQAVNRLEELIENPDIKEIEIQRFFERHPRVLVGGEYLRMHAQVRLEANGRVLIPDFLLEHASGLCDILELKLPAARTTAGKSPRRRYAHGVASAAAQSREYRDFFEDAANREWFERRYNLEAYKPRTVLLIGRDADFKGRKEKRKLEVSFHDYRLLTYDDLLRIAFAHRGYAALAA